MKPSMLNLDRTAVRWEAGRSAPGLEGGLFEATSLCSSFLRSMGAMSVPAKGCRQHWVSHIQTSIESASGNLKLKFD